MNAILDWLLTGEVGISSEAMATVAAGRPVRHRYPCHPHDADDFKRCIKLVDAAPEVRDAFLSIAALSPEWAAIIGHWDELRALFVAEVGGDLDRVATAPRTNARMRELFEGVRPEGW